MPCRWSSSAGCLHHGQCCGQANEHGGTDAEAFAAFVAVVTDQKAGYGCQQDPEGDLLPVQRDWHNNYLDVKSAAQVFLKSLHFSQSMLVSGTVGGSNATMQPFKSLFGTALFG